MSSPAPVPVPQVTVANGSMRIVVIQLENSQPVGMLPGTEVQVPVGQTLVIR